MCGITGIVASDHLTRAERDALPRMRDLLAHRGPDDAGRYFDAVAGLGHRRLAVTDPSGGHQPISNEDGTVWVICNGEIYNHAELRATLAARGHCFATRSDTETIVHAYEEHGDACLDHLRGMFALAIWDASRRRLLLARDRLGVKPLYYHADNRRIVFGSEMKAVLAAPFVPSDIDATALADYLALGFVPSPKTIYAGIQKLEPGQAITFDRGRLTRRYYWQLMHRGFSGQSESALRDQLWERLQAAVADRMIADVPVSLFLSGGADSAAVTSIAADIRTRAEQDAPLTCTIGFPNTDCDERPSARRLAARLGTEHLEYEAAFRTGSLLPRLARCVDEPLADPSALPLFLLSQSARQHCKVALTGDGGDEILAGYRRYRFDNAEQNLRNLAPSWLRRGLIGPVARIYPNSPWLPRSLRARRTLTNLASDGATAHARSIARMDGEQARSLIHPDLRRALHDYDPFDHVRAAYNAFNADSHLARCQAADIRLSLADGILAKADRASMAHGLELRSPMLDHRFVEFAMTIPPALRIRHGQGKYLLQENLRQRLGDDAPTTKRGFSVPLDEYFRNGQHTTSDMTHPSGLLDAAAVQQLAAEHKARRRNAGDILWSIALLKNWQQQLSQTLHGTTPRTIRPPARIDPLVLTGAGA